MDCVSVGQSNFLLPDFNCSVDVIHRHACPPCNFGNVPRVVQIRVFWLTLDILHSIICCEQKKINSCHIPIIPGVAYLDNRRKNTCETIISFAWMVYILHLHLNPSTRSVSSSSNSLPTKLVASSFSNFRNHLSLE